LRCAIRAEQFLPGAVSKWEPFNRSSMGTGRESRRGLESGQDEWIERGVWPVTQMEWMIFVPKGSPVAA
jgi:hypothetical protein